MARVINVEKSQYLTQNIQSFAETKVGQYSKYLDKNPLFVTWLRVSQTRSRHDVGIGGVESDVGPKSPVRYVKINTFPTYGIPELKPDIMYEEQGYDIELEISEAFVLPGTIQPQVGDYIIVSLPSAIELAFRVNSFGYNTVQSNDFYTYSADLKYTGKNLINRFNPQIVDEFDTIFDNIGTEDSCFLRHIDVPKVQAIGLLYNELKDIYLEHFFDREIGGLVCKNNDEFLKANPEYEDEIWLYDKYVTKFVMDSEIYFTGFNDNETIALVNMDVEGNLQKYYKYTLFYAVQKRDTAYLSRYPWYYQVDVEKRHSPLKIYGYACNSVIFHPTDYALYDGHSDGLDTNTLMQYFSHSLIHKILDEDEFEDPFVKMYEDHDYCPKLHRIEEEDITEDTFGTIEGEEGYDNDEDDPIPEPGDPEEASSDGPSGDETDQAGTGDDDSLGTAEGQGSGLSGDISEESEREGSEDNAGTQGDAGGVHEEGEGDPETSSGDDSTLTDSDQIWDSGRGSDTEDTGDQDSGSTDQSEDGGRTSTSTDPGDSAGGASVQEGGSTGSDGSTDTEGETDEIVGVCADNARDNNEDGSGGSSGSGDLNEGDTGNSDINEGDRWDEDRPGESGDYESGEGDPSEQLPCPERCIECPIKDTCKVYQNYWCKLLMDSEADTTELTYLDEIIYNYLLGKNLDIDRKKLVRFAVQSNNYIYRTLPIVIYIIGEYHRSYFKKEDIDL